MKAIYYQKGESLNYQNDTDNPIEAGDVVVFGQRIGIAGTQIPAGELGSIHMVGTFKIPKKTGEKIEAGADVYYSAEGLTAVSGEVGDAAIGYAIMPAAADDSHVTVKLMG